jgi:hypothetical protein
MGGRGGSREQRDAFDFLSRPATFFATRFDNARRETYHRTLFAPGTASGQLVTFLAPSHLLVISRPVNYHATASSLKKQRLSALAPHA